MSIILAVSPFKEEFKPHPDFPGYLISSQGYVLKKNRNPETMTEITEDDILKPSPSNSGYDQVKIKRKGEKKAKNDMFTV